MLKADDLLGLDDHSGSMRDQRSSIGKSVPMDIDVDDDVGQIVDMTGVKVDDDEVSFFVFVEQFDLLPYINCIESRNMT